ncbi:MAG: PaaI family thioesterase [Burkholderiales bacterium]|nr:PaaI family thioesterase [Burkholderiales bacterium]
MSEINPDQVDLHRFAADPGHQPGFERNPMARALGTRVLAIDAQAGTIRLAFAPEGIFVQGTGVLQGGAVSAMLDYSMAFVVLAQLPLELGCTTASMSVSYLRAAPRGAYEAVGEIERRGRRLAFTRSSLYPAGAPDRVVATATSTLAILDKAAGA